MFETALWIPVLVFWVAFALLIFAFAGYPVFLRLLNLVLPPRPKNAPMEEGPLPVVTLVIVVHNEEARIADRLRNLAACDYGGKREILLVCDGCTDTTASVARETALGCPLRLLEQADRKGKAAALNLAASNARGEILVFGDARQRFDRNAVAALVQRLRDTPEAAAVSGSLEIEPSEEGPAAGIDLYWRLEKWIRHEESRRDSVIGCTGAIYAMRREDFHPIPEDTLIDDVVVPMQALVRGRRILFEPGAVAYDPQTLETRHEKRRKVRTLAGNYQMLFRYPGWLLPWKNRCWWQLISHKYLRLGGPLYLAACLGSSLVLAPASFFFKLALAAQALAYLAAIVGMSPLLRRSRAFSVPSGFLFLQVQSAKAFLHYLQLCRRGSSGSW
ncbi:MAG: glycosyltransferase family 2 protein [Verrucomicrobiae bacterium]|nr:glycosyltransferase family 2 protein [Verrucomicrobiae bacterium]